MWWKIEYDEWKPFQNDGEWEELQERTNTWKDTWNRFIELVQDDNVGMVRVITMWGDKIYEPENPYVLVYSAK